MGWAAAYIAKLKNGETVQFRPRDGSMTGKIESGSLCTVEPVNTDDLEVGDIVLCEVDAYALYRIFRTVQNSTVLKSSTFFHG